MTHNAEPQAHRRIPSSGDLFFDVYKQESTKKSRMKTLMKLPPGRFLRLSALTLAALAVLPTPVTHAADIFWSGDTDSYTNAVKWGGVVPGAGDNAINDNGAANAVQINPGDPDWTMVDLSAGSTNSAIGAFQQNGQTVNVNGWFHLGAGIDSTGFYTLNGGILNVLNGRLFLGEGAGSASTLTINGGVLNKAGGVFVIADGGWNGSGARTGIVTQVGGTVNSTSEIWIGQVALGTGIYNLHAGGTINSSNWFVIARSGSEGTMNMDGGSVLQASGGTPAFIVADGGTGTLNHSGGTISTTAAEFWLGNGGDGLGTNNMSGTAVLNVNNWIAIGRGGTGVLNLSGGAINKTGGGNIVIPGSGLGIINQVGGTFTSSSGEVWLPESGTGIWNLSGGTAAVGLVHICQNNGAIGTLNLDGGSFSAAEITTGNAGGFSTLNFNGGTLSPSLSTPNFLHDLSQANVSTGGAIFNTAGFDITVAQSLLDNGGGLTKNGAGTLTLNGANTYSGATVVNAGKLVTTTASSTGGGYTVANNAGIGIVLQSANAQLNITSLTFSGPTAASLDFSLGNFGNPVVAPLNVLGALAGNGTVTLNIADDLPQVGQFSLIQYGSRTGAGNFVIGSLPVGVQAHLATNGTAIDLVITSAGSPRWDGTVVGGVWDIDTTMNWIDLGTLTPTTYRQGNPVMFDDSAAGTTTVNLGTTVNPGKVAFANSTLNYTLTGTGKISGSAGLLKDGAGTVTIANTGGNNYTGVTVITNGVLSVTNLANGGLASPIGAASSNPTNLVLGNGVLSYSGPPVSINRGYTILGTNSTINVQNGLTLSGNVIAGIGSGFIKSGPGQLTYSGIVSNLLSGGYAAGMQVTEGTVKFDGALGNQTNRVMNEVWVGSTTNFGGSMFLTNSMLLVDSWMSVGRGNGSIGNASSLTLNNAIISANGLSFGWFNNLPGNYAFQTLLLNGSSTVTNRGGNGSNLAESGGSTTIVDIKDNSVFGSNPRLIIAGGSTATGRVTVANSGKLYVNSFVSIANGNGAVASVLVKDSGTFFVQTDLNASDTGSSTGSLTVQDNAQVSGGTVYIGKAGTSVGNATVLSGTLTSRGNFRVGQNAGSVGNVTVSGGTVGISGELWMGESGQGNFLQTGGAVWSTNWIAIGRNSGSTGNYIISGGSLAELDPADRFIVGSQGAGTLTISNTAAVTAVANLQLGETASGNGTVNLNGGVLTAPQVVRGGGIGTFNFNGGTLAAANGANATFLNGLSSANVKSGGAFINTGTNSINIGQALLDGTGGGGLTKNGAGTLRLNGVNTYVGTTLVSAGTLGGTGTIAGPVSVASGATLAPGTSIGTLTINNSLTLSAGSSTLMEISLDGGTTNKDQVVGLSAVTYAGSLVVTNVGSNSLASGSVFKLFNSATAGSGNFSSITVLPSGTGTFNPATGELTIGSTTPLAVNPPTVSGGNLILAGTGGTPGGSYAWLTSTNVAAPLANWTTNSVGVFSGTGTFSNAIPVVTSETGRFFRLKTP
jgi:fibronectin-binding autotransporter adhesin